MSFSYWPKMALLALLPAAAIAQQVQERSPTDPNTPVPTSSYVSAFKNYQPSTGEQGPPDTVWRAANEEVASQAEHAGHGGHRAMPGMSANSTASEPNNSRATSPADHSGHMAMPGMKAEAATPQNNGTQSPTPAAHSGHQH
jgi:hypothetical protein